MSIVVGLFGVALILLVIVDSFETTILPRRVTHRYRFVRLFYFATWRVWRDIAVRLQRGKIREAFLSLFGPLSLLALLATWVLGLILGFALVHWSVSGPSDPAQANGGFGAHLYWSGGTFFTLGYGDVVPTTSIGRILAIVEAGMGFGFLALIISYLPVTYQTYSRREMLIALLDARAGSPPSAAQLLLRAGHAQDFAAINAFLAEWERWSAELLESHLSFPVLSYYRSQHENQSWVSSLTAVLDACAIMIALVKDQNLFQAELTFAMARHAAVDLGLVFKAQPIVSEIDRLPPERLKLLREQLLAAGFALNDPIADARLTDLRGMYEPFVNALAARFLFALPQIAPEHITADNWQRSAWMKRAPQFLNFPTISPGDTHFR